MFYNFRYFFSSSKNITFVTTYRLGKLNCLYIFVQLCCFVVVQIFYIFCSAVFFSSDLDEMYLQPCLMHLALKVLSNELFAV
jgi:hypothetical protein